MKARFFAGTDMALENGSFRKLVYLPARARGTACYINGDYMGTVNLSDTAECDAHAEAFKLSGYREYSPTEFKKLAPKCCGGKGRL